MKTSSLFDPLKWPDQRVAYLSESHKYGTSHPSYDPTCFKPCCYVVIYTILNIAIPKLCGQTSKVPLSI